MKETRLREDAYIYHKRKQKGEKQKWGEMNRSQRIQYFKDYYLMKTAAGLAAVSIGGWFLAAILAPKTETDLYIAMINSSAAREKEEKLAGELADLLDCKMPEGVILDSSYFIQLDGMDQGTMGTVQKLSAQAYSGDLDMIIADEEEFHYLARQGYFLDLAEILPTNLYSRLSDYVYIDRIEQKNGDTVEYGEHIVYGIYLKGAANFDRLGTGMEKPVAGIVVNTKKESNGVKALKYLTK